MLGVDCTKRKFETLAQQPILSYHISAKAKATIPQ